MRKGALISGMVALSPFGYTAKQTPELKFEQNGFAKK